MGNYMVFFSEKPKHTDELEGIQVSNANVGFNQLGWLMFTDVRNEVVACFIPQAVSYVLRIDVESKDSDIIDTSAIEVN